MVSLTYDSDFQQYVQSGRARDIGRKPPVLLEEYLPRIRRWQGWLQSKKLSTARSKDQEVKVQISQRWNKLDHSTSAAGDSSRNQSSIQSRSWIHVLRQEETLMPPRRCWPTWSNMFQSINGRDKCIRMFHKCRDWPTLIQRPGQRQKWESKSRKNNYNKI